MCVNMYVSAHLRIHASNGMSDPHCIHHADISKVQDAEVGDGTTSVVVLAAELLKEAERLVAMNLHPQTIIAGWRKATDCAREALTASAKDNRCVGECVWCVCVCGVCGGGCLCGVCVCVCVCVCVWVGGCVGRCGCDSLSLCVCVCCVCVCVCVVCVCVCVCVWCVCVHVCV